MAYDYKSALEAGATEDQILDYLNKTRDYDVQGAIDSGASKSQIIDYLSQTDTSVLTSSQESEKTPGFFGKVARFTGVEKLGQGIGKVLFKLTKESKMLDEMAANGEIDPDEYEAITTGGLTNKEILGSALQTAANFMPGATQGAKLGTKIAVGSGTGYAFDVASNLQMNKKGADIVKPGLGTSIGAALPAIGGIIGVTFEKAPKRIEQINLRLTPVEKQNLAKQGKDIADYLSKKKIIGSPETRYAKVSNLYDQMENKVTEAIKGSGVKFSKKELIEQIKVIPEQFADDIAGYDDAVRNTNKIISFIQRKAPQEISAELLNKYKRQLFKRAYSKNNTDVLNDTLHSVGELFKGKLDKAVKPLQLLNDEYAKIIAAKKILFKAQARSQVGITGKLLGTVGGTSIGAATGGGIGAAAGAVVGEQIAEKAFGTATRSAIGAGVQSLNELVEKIPTDKLGNLQLTKKALISLIEQIRKERD